jgi:hypothetical protein
MKYRALEISTEAMHSLQIQSELNLVVPAHLGKGIESISEVGQSIRQITLYDQHRNLTTRVTLH